MSDRARRDRPLGLAQARVAHAGQANQASRAPDYDDVYCSCDDGLGESRHVFIDGNDLIARFTALAPHSVFVIGETGFGAGRNMLLAWQLFDRYAPATARLRLLSIEAHPLALVDLAEMTARWPDLADRAGRLCALWPAPVVGLHRLWLGARVALDLYFGDVEAGLADVDGQVDAWFLDGFSPAKNPAMWSASVMQAIAAHSRPGASLATYSAAGGVRRNLAAAGFTWRRREGHGTKKHCLSASFTGTLPAAHERELPWYSRLPAARPGARVAVVGAGIAGTTVVDALARRGFSVDVYDGQGVASGASGNRDAVLNPRLAAEASPRTRFDLAALDYASRWLGDALGEASAWRPCGVLQLARSAAEYTRQQRLLARLDLPAEVLEGCGPERAEALAGQPLASDVQGALFFARAGVVDPGALCRALLARHGIAPIAETITALSRACDASAGGWQLTGQSGHTYAADHVVLACAGAAGALCADIAPQQAVAGQASVFSLGKPSASPACVVCDTGYITPARDGCISVGATYDPRATQAVVRDQDHAANRARLTAALPRIDPHLAAVPVCGRTRFRSVSHDRLPMVGGVADVARWRADYADLARDARQHIACAGALWPDLSVHLAHGSNGLLRAPLAAEILASQLADEPLPVATDLAAALHPGRWWIRQIIKGALA